MAIVSDGFINGYKKGVDIAANLNEADVYVAGQLGLQHKCLFEIMIYPEAPLGGFTAKGFMAFAEAATDLFIMRTYLYAINDIPLFGLEYQRTGGMNFIKDLVYPDTFECTFLEDQAGSVKGYFRKWMEKIAIRGATTRDYYFNDDQNASKRTALIIPMQTDMLPSAEWIKIDGLKFKSITGIGYDHASGDNELLTASFSCDNIRLSFGPTAL